MSNPFDESDDEDDVAPSQRNEDLVINKTFADKFESDERKKDLLRAKELLDNDDESDSESEDDEGELISASLDIEIVKVINRIRKKDPKIYDKSTTWFKKQDESDDDDDENKDDEKGGKEKKKRYKDVLREQLLKHGADFDQDTNKNLGDTRLSSVGRTTGALAYDEEQQKIRREFLKSVGDGDDDDEEEDVFRVRAKDPAEQALDELELNKAMTEMRELGAAEAVEETEKSDAFLLDYISKQSWKSKLKYTVKDGSSDDDYEENEEELDKVDLFEHKYNFRFEELQGDECAAGSARTNVIGMGLQSLEVTGHARNVEGSVRRVDEKRKTQREGRKLNKEKEKRVKEAELKRLKSLKNQELQERLRQICEVSGVGEGGLGEMDLDEDWDPEKYEAMMQAQFGDEYYGDDDNAEFAGAEGGADWDGGKVEDVDVDIEGGEQEEYDEGEGDEGDDEGYTGSAAPTTSKSKMVSGMLDELYKLDYEDIIAGMPCRFKYRQVEKEDFGLTADEILLAEDSELNKFVSLKKISAYSDPYGTGDQAQKVAKKRKRLRVAIKERLQKEAEDAAALGMQIKGLKKKAVEESEVVEEEAAVEKDAGSKKRRRRKLKEGAAPSSASADESAVETPVAVAVAAPVVEVEEKASKEKKAQKSEKKRSSTDQPNKKVDKGGKDDRSEVSRKKRKKTEVTSASTARPASSTSTGTGSTKMKSKKTPNGPSENQQRRASLYN